MLESSRGIKKLSGTVFNKNLKKMFASFKANLKYEKRSSEKYMFWKNTQRTQECFVFIVFLFASKCMPELHHIKHITKTQNTPSNKSPTIAKGGCVCSAQLQGCNGSFDCG